jgi:hypothetical protein
LTFCTLRFITIRIGARRPQAQLCGKASTIGWQRGLSTTRERCDDDDGAADGFALDG